MRTIHEQSMGDHVCEEDFDSFHGHIDGLMIFAHGHHFQPQSIGIDHHSGQILPRR